MQLWISIFLIFSTLFLNFGCKKAQKYPEIRNGVLDLRDYDLEKTPLIPLKGEWKFFWNEFIPPENIEKKLLEFQNAKIPHRFSDIEWKQEKQTIKLPNDGFGTYYLRILLKKKYKDLGFFLSVENTAYKLFVNGNEELSIGKIGTSKETSRPSYKPETVHVTLYENEINLVIHVSNFHNRNGGLRNEPKLGSYVKIKQDRELSISLDLIVFGALFITGLYNLCLFALRKNDKSTLYFAVYALIYSIKTLFENQRIFLVAYPNFPWEGDLKISYLVTFFSPHIFLGFLYYLFPGSIHKRMFYGTLGLSSMLSLIVLATPARIYSQIAFAHQIYILLLGFYGLYVMIQAFRKKEQGSFVLLLGYIVFFLLAGINDSLYSSGLINSIYLSSYALVVFVFTQGFAIAIKSANAYKKVESLGEELLEKSKSISRFIPKEFLSILGKEEIQGVEIGDHIAKVQTVLFTDIRSFTVLSESMTAEQTFNFINSYLNRMNPVIQRNKGFIDKFIGDAIMALFESPDDALTCALEMIDELEIYNFHRQAQGYQPIKIGVGINTGRVVMGTVGNEHRMDTTVIGDTVNLASRIESLTKEYQCNIIISDFTFRALKNQDKFELREIDAVHVKGKSIPVALYECFNFDPIELRKAKRATHHHIMIGLSLKNAGNYLEAIEEFLKSMDITDEDPIPKIQIKKCETARALENMEKKNL